MTDCPFELNTDDLWQCPQCGWVYKLKSVKPPRRNCPKAPDREEAEKQRLDRELQELVDSGAAKRTMEEIQATLRECRGGCVHHVNHLCVRRGHDCTRRKRWIECLIFNGCEKVMATGRIQKRQKKLCELVSYK